MRDPRPHVAHKRYEGESPALRPGGRGAVAVQMSKNLYPEVVSERSEQAVRALTERSTIYVINIKLTLST